MKKILPALLSLVILLALGACRREAKATAGCLSR